LSQVIAGGGRLADGGYEASAFGDVFLVDLTSRSLRSRRRSPWSMSRDEPLAFGRRLPSVD